MRSTAPTPDLRAALETRRVGYVLAIAGTRRLPTAAGPIRADALAAAVGRTGREGPAVLRLGLARAARPDSTRRRRGRYRLLVAADPPLAAHR